MEPCASRVAVLCLIIASLLPGRAERALTNDDIRRMVQAGSDEASVIAAIQASKPDFDTSVPELLALHKGGVSQRILRAMLSASRRDTAGRVPLPNEVGIYLKRDGAYVQVQAERVEWGWYTVSFKRARLYAVAAGPRSFLQVVPPVEFLIVCPLGASAADYGLLRGDPKRHVSFGVALGRRVFPVEVHKPSINADFYWNNTQQSPTAFEAEELAPRKYSIKLPQLEKGEYGFLAPGLLLQNMTHVTRRDAELYTLRIP